MNQDAPILNLPPDASTEDGGSGRMSRGPGRRPDRDVPVATLVLVTINVVVFLLTTLAGGLRDADVLLDFGASYRPYILRGEYWRLVMPIFLHHGPIHLALNTFGVYVLGGILERVYGYGRFAAIYVGAGMGGAYLSSLLSHGVGLGASGAIFGVAGAMVATGYLHPEVVPPRWRRVLGLGLVPFILMDLALDVLAPVLGHWTLRAFGVAIPRIDNWAHIGGLFSGMVLAGLIPPPKPRLSEGEHTELKPRPRAQWIVVIPVAIVATAMVMTGIHYPKSRAVTRLLTAGIQLEGAQKHDEAFKRLQEAERLNRKDERPHEQLGLFYLQQNRAADAINEYQQALKLNPDSVDAKLGLAQAFKEQGDDDKAQQYLRDIQKDFPDDATSQYELGALYYEHKMYAEAIAHYQEALRLEPGWAAAHNDLAWLYATADDPRYRNPEQALDHARQAVDLDHWKEPAFIDTLAEALYANKQYSEAVKVQSKTLERDPKNSEYKDHMQRYQKAAGG